MPHSMCAACPRLCRLGTSYCDGHAYLGTARGRGLGREWAELSRRLIAASPHCALCPATTDLTVDHRIPRHLGGTAELSNLQVLCRSCNSSKAAGWELRYGR